MFNQNSTRNGQPSPPTDNRIFDDWTRQAETAIDALFVWKAWLRAWQSHPLRGQLPDGLFMDVVQNMNEAGLMEWLDANRAGLDALREAVTGGER